MNELIPAVLLGSGVVCAVVGRRLLRDPVPAPTFAGRAATPETTAPQTGEEETLLGRALRIVAARIGPLALGVVRAARRRRIAELLDAAGHPVGMTVARFVGLKMLFTGAFGIAGSVHAASGRPYVTAAFVVAGWFATDVWLRGEAKARQAQLDEELPVFLDVFAVSVAAGVEFRPALEAVTSAAGGVLGAEMRRALDAVAMGDRLEDALSDLRCRNPAPGLSRAVGALVDTLELGTPVAAVLATISADVRQRRREQVLTRAARTAPRISIIVAFTLVPACLAVVATALLLGPATDLWDVFGG